MKILIFRYEHMNPFFLVSGAKLKNSESSIHAHQNANTAGQ